MLNLRLFCFFEKYSTKGPKTVYYINIGRESVSVYLNITPLSPLVIEPQKVMFLVLISSLVFSLHANPRLVEQFLSDPLENVRPTGKITI